MAPPPEVAKGAIMGQMLRVANPKRYRYLKTLRPDRKLLAQHKKALISKIKAALADAGLKPVKVFGRVKTIGSIDRKEKYMYKKYHKDFKKFTQNDILGITVVMESMPECYAVLGAAKKMGEFPEGRIKENPADYSKTQLKDDYPRPKGMLRGYFKAPEFSMAQLTILTRQTYWQNIGRRAGYKKYVNEWIKGKRV